MELPISENEANMTSNVLASVLVTVRNGDERVKRFLENKKVLTFYENGILETAGNHFNRVYETDETIGDLFMWDSKRLLYLPYGMGISRDVVDAFINDGARHEYMGLPMGMVFPKDDRRIKEVLSLGDYKEHDGFREFPYVNAKYEGSIRVYESPTIRKFVDPRMN